MATADPRPIPVREAAGLAALLALAAVVRAFRFAGTSLMFNDGPTFLTLARMMSENRFPEALGHAYHPLYPFLTLVAWLGLGDWERAAACVSILSGTLAVLFLFLFTRDAFGRRAGWIAAIVLATQARALEWSADVQSDGLYLAMFLGAVFFLWRALRSGRASLAGWAGVFAGLAYLARPEGAGLILVGGALLALAAVRGRLPALRAVGAGAALFAAALLVMGPYLVSLRVSNGAFVFTQKKALTQLLGVEEAAAPAPQPGRGPDGAAAREWAVHPPPPTAPVTGPPRVAGRPFLALAEVCHAASRALRPWMVPLLLVGLFLRRGRPGETGTFVGLIVLLYGAVLVRQDLRYDYVDPRHTLPPLVPAFGYLAAGIEAVAAGLLAGVARLRHRAAPGVRTAAVVGSVLVAAGGLGQALRPERPGPRAEREAALWLKAQPLPEGAVAATKGRLAFYAGRPYVSLHGGPAGGLLPYLRERGVRFVIVDDERLESLPELDAARGDALRELVRIEDRGRSTFVYEIAGGR